MTNIEAAQPFLKQIFDNCEHGNVEFRFLPSKQQVFWPLTKFPELPVLDSEQDCYFGCATRNGGGKKEHIVEIPCLWTDNDFKLLPQEKIDQLLADCPFPPSAQEFTGGGYHCFWLLKKPAGKEDIPLVESLLRRLAVYFNADPAACDASRILRVPGTFNHKPEYAKPKVEILSLDPSRRYDLGDFDQWLPDDSKKKTASGEARKTHGWQDEALKGVGDGLRHDTALQLAGRWAAKGHSAAEITQFIIAWNEKNTPPKGELSNPESKELQDIVESAIAKFQTSKEEAHEWPEPFDIFGDPTLAGSPVLKAEYLPKVVADFAVDAAERIGVPLEMIAIPALGVAAGAISDYFTLQVKEYDQTWVERSKIWIGMVADSGQKKTPALNTVLAPLKRIEADLHLENQEKRERYKEEMEEYRKKVKQMPEYSHPERPAFKRKLAGDVTVEALRDILADNPEGILIVKDELSGWFTSFDQYKAKGGGSDRAHFIELFNGGVHFIDRVKDGGCSVMVPNWSAGLIGGIQPGPMKRLAGKISDDGLIQRFLVFYTSTDKDGVDKAPSLNAIKGFHDAIHKLSQANTSEYVFRFDKDSHKVRKLLENYVGAFNRLPDTPDHLKAHLSKYPIFFARLCLTYHLMDCMSGEHLQIVQTVTADTAVKVYSLLLNFFLPHALHFFEELVAGENDTNHAKWIAGYILSGKSTEISAREIYRSYRPLRGERRNEIPIIMEKLVLGGWVELVDGVRRENLKWAVNPRVHEIFGEIAERERERREAEKNKIAEKVAFIRAAREVTGG